MEFKKLMQSSAFPKHFFQMCSTKEALSEQGNRGALDAEETTHYCGTGKKQGSELSDSEVRLNPWDKCGVEGGAREMEMPKLFWTQKSMSEFQTLNTELQWLYLCPVSSPSGLESVWF